MILSFQGTYYLLDPRLGVIGAEKNFKKFFSHEFI
jgi:hypothetical protein